MKLEALPNDECQNNIVKPLVLVVDDNEDNLQLLVQILIILGCSYISSKHGNTAILLAQNRQPNLILLDIMLPDVDGMEVVQRLKQNPQTLRIPIIAVTAMARTEDRDRMLLAGCNDYLKKPYTIDEIEAIIRRYLFNI